MRYDILAVGLRESYLTSFAQIMQGQKCAVIPSFSSGVAVWLLTQRRFSAVLMDLAWFNRGSHALLQEIRNRSLPLIVLGSEGEKYSHSVEAETEWFLSYKLPPRRLAERIAAILCPDMNEGDYTQWDISMGTPIARGDFFLDRENGYVNVCGRTAHLTPEEAILLNYLLSHANQLLSYQKVCATFWTQANGYGRDESTLVNDLRKKIEPDPEHPIYLQDIPNIGYWFQDTME